MEELTKNTENLPIPKYLNTYIAVFISAGSLGFIIFLSGHSKNNSKCDIALNSNLNSFSPWVLFYLVTHFLFLCFILWYCRVQSKASYIKFKIRDKEINKVISEEQQPWLEFDNEESLLVIIFVYFDYIQIFYNERGPFFFLGYSC